MVANKFSIRGLAGNAAILAAVYDLILANSGTIDTRKDKRSYNDVRPMERNGLILTYLVGCVRFVAISAMGPDRRETRNVTCWCGSYAAGL